MLRNREKIAEGGFHLHGQLPGGFENEATRPPLGFPKERQDRQGKGSRFSGTCLSRGNEVASGQNHRECAQLNGCGIHVTHALRPVNYCFGKSEILK